MAATGTTRLSPDIEAIPFQGPFSVEITRLGFDVSEVNPPGRCQMIIHPVRLALHLHWLIMNGIYDPELEHMPLSERGQAILTNQMSVLTDNGANLLIADVDAQLADSAGVLQEWDQLKLVIAEKLASDPECMALQVLDGWAPLRTRVVIAKYDCTVAYMTDHTDGTRIHVSLRDALMTVRRRNPILVVCSQDHSRRSDVAEADEVGMEQQYEASLDDDVMEQEHDASLDDDGMKQEREASVDDIDSAMRDIDLNASDTESPAVNDSQAGNISQPGHADAALFQASCQI